MNILILSQVFPPKRGGVQTLTYNTAKYLANLRNIYPKHKLTLNMASERNGNSSK